MLSSEQRAHAETLKLPRELEQLACSLDEALKERFESDLVPNELRASLAYQFSSGGKRFRPLLALLMADAFDVAGKDAVRFAMALEAMHNACLIRDDIEDEDVLRRGIPALWCRVGTSAAMNVADYLIMESFCLISELDVEPSVRVRIQREFSEALRSTTVGQAADLGYDGSRPLTCRQWERIAELKTARFLGLSLTGPAFLSGASDEQLQQLREVSRGLGIAFQLRDDILDLRWDKGRDRTANDVREGKPSYLVAWLLENGGLRSAERQRLFDLLSSTRESTLESEVLWFEHLVRERGAVRAATEVQRQTFRSAVDRLRTSGGVTARSMWTLDRLMSRLAL